MASMTCLTWLDQAMLSDLPLRRRWSYLCFALALFVALGSNSFINPVKTSIFLDVVGTAEEPVAKSLVPAVLLPVLFSYSILVSRAGNPKVFATAVCGAFALIFGLVVIGLLAQGPHSRVWAAWLLYYATETRSVIIMPMIWSVVTDLTSPEVAAKAYPPIFFVIQLGGIFGSLVAIKVSSLGGEVGLVLMQVVSFVAVAALIWCACSLVGDGEDGEVAPLVAAGTGSTGSEDAERGRSGGAGSGVPEEKGLDRPDASCLGFMRAGLDGLWLLLSRPYVFGAFWVSYAFLLPRTLLEYQNNVLAIQSMPSRHDQIAFFGRVTLFQSVGTAVLTLLGTRPLVERMGVSGGLLVLPPLTLGCVLALCAHRELVTSTWCLVISCVLAYGLNSPCKEMLFVRTSRDIKYKAKAWSEMYGNNVMKLLGAQMNLWVNLESDSCQPHCFRQVPTVTVVTTWIVLWVAVAVQLGREHRRLELEGKHVQ